MTCLDFLLLAILNSLLLLRSVSSVQSRLLVKTYAKFVVMSQYSHCPQKALTEILPSKLIQYQRPKKIHLETRYLAISSNPFISVAESFLYGIAMALPCVETARA